MKNLNFSLMPTQAQFVFDLEHGEQGMTGGFRAGKSWCACHKAIFMSAIHRGKKGALLSPTYGMTRRNLIPIMKVLDQQYSLNIRGLGVKSPDVLEINWGGKISQIHLDITAENHDRLNGITLAWGGYDEIDKTSSMETAMDAWNQLGTRLSDPMPGYRGIQFGDSTPEGFGAMYHIFEETKDEDKILYRMSMLDNYMLAPSYIEAQKRKIPAHLFKSYILGEFANVYKNIVYVGFDRELNNSTLTLADLKPGEILHVGVDFNSNGMSAVGFIIRKEVMPNSGIEEQVGHFVYENIGATNTPDLARKLKHDLLDKGVNVLIYPDPSCIAEKSNSPNTDFTILRQFNFKILKMNIAPEVMDRVNSVNARFHNYKGDRRLKVNTKACPLFTKALSLQVFDLNGEPKKKEKLPGTAHTQIDGPIDAGGYPVFSKWPLLTNNSTRRPTLTGFY